jgi:hypothetical protein
MECFPEKPESMPKSSLSTLAFVFAAVAATPLVAQQPGELGGLALVGRAAHGNFQVNVRDAHTVELAGATTGSEAGQFAFLSLQPGKYVVEIVDAAGNTVGLSPSIPLASGATVTVTVGATAAGALASGGGLSLLSLGPIARVAVAGATDPAVTSVLATRAGKLMVCHRLSDSDSQTLEIRESARTGHMGHGDTLGGCPAAPQR